MKEEHVKKKTATVTSFLSLTLFYFHVSDNMQVQKTQIFKLVAYMFDFEHVFLQ